MPENIAAKIRFTVFCSVNEFSKYTGQQNTYLARGREWTVQPQRENREGMVEERRGGNVLGSASSN